jgi:hypothetical protein
MYSFPALPRQSTALPLIVLVLLIPWPIARGQEAAMPPEGIRSTAVVTDTAGPGRLLTARGAQRVYCGSERRTLGMPCGGICAGQLYVLGDGELGVWEVDGATYFGGVGHASYRSERPRQPCAQGFAIATAAPGARPVRALLNDSGYDAIEFVGEYPRALVRYRAQQAVVPPVSVELEAFRWMRARRRGRRRCCVSP